MYIYKLYLNGYINLPFIWLNKRGAAADGGREEEEARGRRLLQETPAGAPATRTQPSVFGLKGDGCWYCEDHEK